MPNNRKLSNDRGDGGVSEDLALDKREVSIIYDRMGGNETIVGVFHDPLRASQEFKKLRARPTNKLLSLTTVEIQ